MIDLNDLLALTLLALLWLAISSRCGGRCTARIRAGCRLAGLMVRLRRTDLRNHVVHAWPDR